MPRLAVSEALRILMCAGVCVGLRPSDGAPVTSTYGTRLYEPEPQAALRWLMAHPVDVLEWLAGQSATPAPEPSDALHDENATIGDGELDAYAKFWAWEAKRRG